MEKQTETYLRKLIREFIEEAEVTVHSRERFINRFLEKSEFNVGYEVPDTLGRDSIIVGTYIVPERVKNAIRENIQTVESKKFPLFRDYGIKLWKLHIDKDNIKYNSEKSKELAQDKNIIIIDDQSKSAGDSIYAIVRDNRIITIQWAKSYVKQTPEKLRVDMVYQDVFAL